MKKKGKWQLWLIVFVILLTIYNILPTLFFYAKPLNSEVTEKEATQTASAIISRVNALEKNSLEWLKSFNRLLGIKAKEIRLDKETPEIIEVEFNNAQDLALFNKFLPRAGSLIAFFPEQLTLRTPVNTLYEPIADVSQSQFIAYVERRIPMQFDPSQVTHYFHWTKIKDSTGHLSSDYWNFLQDRLKGLMRLLGGPSDSAGFVAIALEASHPRSEDFLYFALQNILSLDQAFQNEPQIKARFFASFLQGCKDPASSYKAFVQKVESYQDLLLKEKSRLLEQIHSTETETTMLTALENREKEISKGLSILRKYSNDFQKVAAPWSMKEIDLLLSSLSKDAPLIEIRFDNKNPLIDKILLNTENLELTLTIKDDLIRLRDMYAQKGDTQGESALNQLFFDTVSQTKRDLGEEFLFQENQFTKALLSLPDASSILALDLSTIAYEKYNFTKKLLESEWQPSSQNLKKEEYPLIEWSAYENLSLVNKNLKLVLYSPLFSSTSAPIGFKQNSIYLIAKDLGRIIKNVQENQASDEQKKVESDLKNLFTLLKESGFTAYSGSTYPLPPEFINDIIFEASDYYLPILMASRENFAVHGSKKWALLEFSNVKERLLTLNKIDTEIHESLLKWKDEYHKAQVDPTLRSKYDVPKPTQNPLYSNFILSFKKYFRGDERKILHWGLDLSGGKTVQIALRDPSNKLVTNSADIKQAMNELYDRVNKMGVSDVSIRQEGNNITLDFPGSGSISASELIKASSMTFNIVNEKFSPDNQGPNASDVRQFLQEIWNEALVTNKKDIDSINQIAWSHLYGDALDPESASPRTESAKVLYQRGLRLANPQNPDISSQLNTSESRIQMYRGDDFASWHGEATPLMIVFKNYALEGSSLDMIHPGYDPSKGNFLSFGVKSSSSALDREKTSPRDELYAWTSVFAKERIMGTEYESFSHGHGWRMAVILNGYVVSAPTLESPLRDSGTISGHFTQREINHLAADLKAGSLSFTPQILSESSVSPELGAYERTQGIFATCVALLAVIVLMVGYYRFGGIVASVAVLFNLLIIWATLQNIGATITLAMLAGIILTVGMAVDANVLVFERIREEFQKSGKLAISVQSGYKRAFSAILDSNITTIIAALILLHFDSGPIKGFAVSLIIGIVSSMFTALFMTKFFFLRWIQNPKHKELKMAHWIKNPTWNFMKVAKSMTLLSLLFIGLGGFMLFKERGTLFGMDFTGGFSAMVQMTENTAQPNTQESIRQALLSSGLTNQDFQIRELSDNRYRILLSKSMDREGKPFYKMPLEREINMPTYSYETNPRLVWLVDTLQKGGLTLSSSSLEKLDLNWKSVSGQMSDSMKTNALIGLFIAFIAILIYITLRFEFKYAISSTLGLVFDVFITIAILAILHSLGVPIQIDLNTIAALMTIIGYSLNDTIIVFDRIREDIKLSRKHEFRDIINMSINTTLSRTLLTSGTTLAVLIALVLLGGNSIFGFSLTMAIGVVIGTFSTFFIASFLLLFFSRHETHHHKPLENGA